MTMLAVEMAKSRQKDDRVEGTRGEGGLLGEAVSSERCEGRRAWRVRECLDGAGSVQRRVSRWSTPWPDHVAWVAKSLTRTLRGSTAPSPRRLHPDRR